MAGATFKLCLSEQEDTFVSAISDSHGKVFFNAKSTDNRGNEYNIFAFKKYMLQEVSAPDGYVKNTNEYTVEHYEDPNVAVSYKTLNEKIGITTYYGEIANVSKNEILEKTRDISIEKIQIDGTVGERFYFNVTVDGNHFTGSYQIGGAVMNAVEGVITLKGGEKSGD